MAGKKRVIETGVDKLVRLVNKNKQISVKEAAKELGVSSASVEEWADFLEEEGIISIQSKLATVYLVEKKLGQKDIKEKVKQVAEEKEEFLRRVESSINTLERDNREIKLIDGEFKEIKNVIDKNFKRLSGKLEKLEDFRKSHHSIEMKKRDVEKEYEGKLEKMQKKLEKESYDYHDLLKDMSKELDRMKQEEQKITELQQTEDKLQKKLDDIDKEITEVQKEIKKENMNLVDDKTILQKTEQNAQKMKDEIEVYPKEIEDMRKSLEQSRKEMEDMEKEFLKDIESLESGKLEKVGAFKEAKDIVARIQAFFDKTKEVEDLIHKAGREENDLRERFEHMVKKAKAFKVMTNEPELKQEMTDLEKDLRAIEDRKTLLGGQLKKLRTLVRGIMKS